MFIRLMTLFVAVVLLPDKAYAEKTIDLYGGIANTHSSNVTVRHSTESTSEPINGSSGIFGVKIVNWIDTNDFLDTDEDDFEEQYAFGDEDDLEKKETFSDNDSLDINWLGLGLDLYGFQANGATTESFTLALAANVIIRYPNDTWQPYIGTGLILHYSYLRASEDNIADLNLGMDLRAGVSWVVNNNFSLFTEYRYSHINIKYENEFLTSESMKASLNTSHFLVGISFPYTDLFKHIKAYEDTSIDVESDQ